MKNFRTIKKEFMIKIESWVGLKAGHAKMIQHPNYTLTGYKGKQFSDFRKI